MNRSLRLASLASLVPCLALVACSAAPGESLGRGTDDLGISRAGGSGVNDVVCAYFYVDDDTLPRETGASSPIADCANPGDAIVERAFDRSVPFEATLASLGCKSALASAPASPVSDYDDGTHDVFVALCPDSCNLWATAAQHESVAPFAMTTKTAPIACVATDGAGQAPAGWTYVMWNAICDNGGTGPDCSVRFNPKCPSGCVHVQE